MEKIEEIMETYIDGKEQPIIEDDEIFENVICKISNKYNKIDNNGILNELIDIKKNKLEKAEEKIINKIHDKFDIKSLNQKDPIDLVYTFINYNDYENKKMNDLIKNLKVDFNCFNIIQNFINEEKKFYYDFFVNLEMTRKNMPFLRYIFIITPTPFLLNEIYYNDSQIIILSVDDLVDLKNLNKDLFRPNNIIYYLKNIKLLSDIFLFGSNDCLISGNLKIESKIFQNKLKIFLEKKSLNENNINNLRYLEEYNANKLFENKFNIFYNLTTINQFNWVRKDSLKMVGKIFGEHNNLVDYLLLQYLTGIFFNLYELEKEENFSGFYQFNKLNPFERFLKLQKCDTKYFCYNYITDKTIPYYLYSAFINMKLLKSKKLTEVYVIGSNYVYKIPQIERLLREHNINLKWLEKLGKYRGRIGRDLFISKKPIEVNTILIVSEDNILNEISYFCNINLFENLKRGRKLDIYFPKDFIRKTELKTSIPYTRILPYTEFDEESTGIRNCKLQFRKNDLKNIDIL